LNDEPGTPARTTPPRHVIDFHTHAFPTDLFRSIWKHYEQHLWPVRYQGETDDLVQTLLSSGIQRFVLSSYAERPGEARALNRWTAELTKRCPASVPFGALHPLDDVSSLVEEAFDELKLAGLEIHCAAQRCYPDDPALLPAYAEAERRRKVCLLHCSQAPEPSHYTDLRRLERLLRLFPGLPVVVAHMGADQFDRFYELMARCDNLYLDTSLIFAGFPDWTPRLGGLIEFQDRVLYASGFPTLPYDLNSGLEGLLALQLGTGLEDKILYTNAARLLGLSAPVRL
jgi:hypothetical protein